MCFICDRVTVEGSNELRTETNFQSKISAVMPKKTTILTTDWLQPSLEDCDSGECIPSNSDQDISDENQNESHNMEVWYDAIDDITLLETKDEDFTLWPSLSQSNAMDESSDNLTFYDAVDNFTEAEMENMSNVKKEASTSNTGQSEICTKSMACCRDNCQSKTDIDWEDGFEFYLWPNEECEDSDSDCESDDEECEDEEDYDEDIDTDSDFIIFEESDRTANYASSCPKPNCKYTDKKSQKHVHFSPELVTVYVVTWSDEECRKGPWIQCAVDRMHFRHRIEQLEQILTPCLLLKQKLGYKFIETMH